MIVNKTKDKKLVAIPEIPQYGKTINVLIDLGNCYKITSGYFKITKNNVYEYINLAKRNIPVMEANASQVYSKSLEILNKTLDRFSELEENIGFGWLCEEYYVVKEEDEHVSPSERFKFMRGITANLGNSAEESV